jgi:LacI family transcriptional regulator
MGTKAPKTVMTVQKVAEMAGVSRAAVSAVLNNRWGTVRLNEQTRKKIETILQEIRFKPNSAGKALVSGRSLMIGMAVTGVDASFVPTILHAVEDFTEKKGYGLLLMSTREDPLREDQILEFMLARNVDGIIMRPISHLSKKVKKLLSDRKVPFVYLSPPPPDGIPGAGSVYANGTQIGYLGLHHLLERGHRHIACLRMMDSVKDGIDLAASEFGGTRIDHWPIPDPPFAGLAIVEHWKKARPRPTALFVPGDDLACLIINAAIQQGIRIPQDLALVGIDDLPIAAEALIPLTTISQPKYEYGQAAVRILFNMIEGKPGETVVLQPSLVIRRTT